ncbi:hypothetical protein FSP39_014647 [Pinctada imbricata]|uniref:Integrase catalytic domain-containing protein n=1 Tax=Pinctada imbricata TaxID=66713 RepID=A0AA89C4L3_PINIB|nr:hypothetical protein FSP39_014647 [Pinctada imbricata]
MIPSVTPDYPWQIVATDLFTLDCKEHIIVVDYYSRYFEVIELTSTQSKVIIQKLKSVFARFGIPEKLVSDNGPQYSSAEFAKFAKDYNFQHTTSSPHYAQSNGLAERCVQTAKRILKKAKIDHQDPYLALLAYRTTPLENGYSPAELLQGRIIRTTVPILPSQLLPRKININKVKAKHYEGRKLDKSYYDIGAHSLRPLEEGEYVRFQLPDKTWKLATVVGKADDMSRSYFIKSNQGVIYRRNRRSINKTHELKMPEPDFALNWTPTIPQTSIPQNVDQGHAPILETNSPRSNKIVDLPNKVTVPNSPPRSIAPTGNQGQPYITRSGRTVKPKVITSY